MELNLNVTMTRVESEGHLMGGLTVNHPFFFSASFLLLTFACCVPFVILGARVLAAAQQADGGLKGIFACFNKHITSSYHLHS